MTPPPWGSRIGSKSSHSGSPQGGSRKAPFSGPKRLPPGVPEKHRFLTLFAPPRGVLEKHRFGLEKLHFWLPPGGGKRAQKRRPVCCLFPNEILAFLGTPKGPPQGASPRLPQALGEGSWPTQGRGPGLPPRALGPTPGEPPPSPGGWSRTPPLGAPKGPHFWPHF